jgi:ribosome-associated protein
VIASGDSDRQVRAVASHVQQTMAASRVDALSIEGLSTAQWILIDYADIVVHVFRGDIRGHYGLEKLWSDAKRVRIPATREEGPLPVPAPKRRSAAARERL